MHNVLARYLARLGAENYDRMVVVDVVNNELVVDEDAQLVDIEDQ